MSQHPHDNNKPLKPLQMAGHSAPSGEAYDLDEARSRQANGQSRSYWRSIDAVLENENYRKWTEDEFPDRESIPQIDRRKFLKLSAATAVMATMAGCRRLPQEKIVPFVKQPEERTAGIPEYYATTFTLSGYGTGVLAKQREGRPIKLEGNPDHPASLGTLDPIALASIHTLYDPDRLKTVVRGRELSSWEEFFVFIRADLEARRARQGAGFAILTPTITSPALGSQLKRLQARFPQLRWAAYEPVNREGVHAGAELAFGQPLNPVYRFTEANVILSLDSDFLAVGGSPARYQQDFAQRRRIEGTDASGMNRLYAVETAASLTGANSDHRFAVKPSDVEKIARALAARLGVAVDPAANPLPANVVDAIVADLQAQGGRALVIAGEHTSPATQALAHAMNAALGATGRTVTYTIPVEVTPANHSASLANLVQAMNGGQVETLLIMGGNPVYDSPADVKFTEALAKVKNRIHFGLYDDETGAVCDWHLPESHYLESWGDARAFDGTISIVQPLIAPLYRTLSPLELVNGLLGDMRPARELLGALHTPGLDAKATDKAVSALLERGVVPNSSLPPISLPAALNAGALPAPSAGAEYELVILPDPTIYDGRFANHPWLQELPKPMTSTTWDNTVLMSPATAQKLGVKQEEKVTVKTAGGEATGAVWLVPGQAEGVIVVHLGYGRTRGGRIVEDEGVRGFNAYQLRTLSAPHGGPCTVTKAGGTYPIATVQFHHELNSDNIERDIVRSGTVADFEKNPRLEPYKGKDDHKLYTLYNQDEWKFDGPQWAMTIDLTTCTGCGACTMACQSENNIPAVGKEQVMRGREMHWIRVDRYYKGTIDDPGETVFQPMACVHCEHAPCEPVCPVAATVHSHEGLNQMVYNRCVGTRYCSNNCPYKVRRFNFLNYADKVDHPSLLLLANPEVTVRGRGVMEKCTYCVQRINSARIEAKKGDGRIPDGAVRTACQQACPSQAIVFGALNDENSQVAKSRRDPRNYTVLRELGVRPRTTYLVRVKNPNPALKA